MVRDSFAAFILSHGRANKVVTVDTLKKEGYTGNWYLVLDDEDDQIDIYKKNFGEDHIIIFSKKEVSSEFDIMDNFDGNKVIVYARNALNKIAKDMGLKYFWELEDDYYDFSIRMEMGDHLPILQIEDLDGIIEAFLDFLDTTKIKTIAFAQTGEMIGGKNGNIWRERVKRKAMNTFFFRVEDAPITPGDQFIGRMNDDVNWYIDSGKRGNVILQTAEIALAQEETQKNKSGNSTVYKSMGTYVKSFYSILTRPDCVKIHILGSNHGKNNGMDQRIHHKIYWENCVPKIVSSKFKK